MWKEFGQKPEFPFILIYSKKSSSRFSSYVGCFGARCSFILNFTKHSYKKNRRYSFNQGKNAVLDGISKDGPKGFILPLWKQALSRHLGLERKKKNNNLRFLLATVLMTCSHKHTHYYVFLISFQFSTY